LQLTVSGYTKDGRPVPEEKMASVNLIWEFQTKNQAFSVDEAGLLTAHRDGIGNVWVKKQGWRFNFRPITVIVNDPS